MGISFLFSLPFASLLFSAICKASSDNYFAFLHFFFLGMVLITNSCTMLWTCIHSSPGTLSNLIPWIYFSLPLYNYMGFDVGHTYLVVFPTFFNLSLNLAIRSSWSESQSSPSLLFADCIELLPLDMEQQTASKSGKEYIKVAYCHPAYLTYMQSTSCEMPGWMKHKLGSRLPGEISITPDMHMTPPLWQKAKN